MKLQQKFYYTLCSLSLIAPLVSYANSKLVTIPENITVNGTISPELRAYGDHLIQEVQKRTDESLEKVTQNFRVLTKETVEATTKSTKELTQQFIDGGIPVKINVTSEDIKNAFNAGSYTLELKIDHNTMVNGSVGGVTLASFLTSAYQFNLRNKEITSKDVVVPAVVAGIGLLYLVLKNGYPKQETKLTGATSAPSTAQPAKPKNLLAQRPEIPVVFEEIKKEIALKSLSDTGANNANRATIG